MIIEKLSFRKRHITFTNSKYSCSLYEKYQTFFYIFIQKRRNIFEDQLKRGYMLPPAPNVFPPLGGAAILFAGGPPGISSSAPPQQNMLQIKGTFSQGYLRSFLYQKTINCRDFLLQTLKYLSCSSKSSTYKYVKLQPIYPTNH